MTNQTTYRQKMRNDEEEIDLVQMMRYILQKWKILLRPAWRAVMGGAFGAIKTGKQPAQMDIDDLNIDQIQQYVSYHQFYEDEITRQAESIYMNMNPEAGLYGEQELLCRRAGKRSEPHRPLQSARFFRSRR